MEFGRNLLVTEPAGNRNHDLRLSRGERVESSEHCLVNWLHEVSPDLWRTVFSVNVDGAYLLSRAFLPNMIAVGAGSIVNVASEAAMRGNAAGAAYTASKHAVVGMTKSAAFMYGPEGIRVNAVAPGPVATAITGTFASEFAADRLREFMPLTPPVVEPERGTRLRRRLVSSVNARTTQEVLA